VLASTLAGQRPGRDRQPAGHGYTHLELGKYLLWYLLPQTVDCILLAVLAVFLQVRSARTSSSAGA
jgi:ABC-2 type transport system permease protein